MREVFLIFGAGYGANGLVLTRFRHSQNGDDAIELFLTVLLLILWRSDVDGTGEAWEWLDSWALGLVM